MCTYNNAPFAKVWRSSGFRVNKVRASFRRVETKRDFGTFADFLGGTPGQRRAHSIVTGDGNPPALSTSLGVFRITTCFVLLCIKEPEQQHSVNVAVPIRERPDNKPRGPDHHDKAFGPEHRKEDNLVRSQSVEMEGSIQSHQGVYKNNTKHNASRQEHPANPGPTALLLSQMLNQFLLFWGELHIRG
jgi:hypothetical protein